ncbi:EthD family reductase [Mycolicibacterium gadium]|uniref:EthD family reductase n=1 Tax=Mycolicibacterium gadium TaxID=1794 RepID=A0ABT6GQP9_MYCGU|nr:EthD family reductase [Mycolicibacterium gadium]MDG5483618.1 EthD family reductase [Mycolicibacterium gadium]
MSETKLTVIYDNPTNPDEFESAYQVEQLEAARRIPGHLRLEASKVWPKEDGSPTPAYRSIDLYFPDYDSACVAVATPEAQAFFEAVNRLATGGVRLLMSDIEVPAV